MIREFTEMTEEYLLLLHLREEKFKCKKMLATIYNDRNIYDLFAQETQKLLKKLAKNPYRDEEYYLEVYELNFAYFFHPATKKSPDNDVPLLEMMDSLDKGFALAKFRIGSEMLNRAKIYSKQYDIRLFEELKEIVKTDFSKDNVLFQLYSLLLQFYEATEPDKELIFKELKLIFSQNFKNLRHLDQSLFLTQLINFTVQKINRGETLYYKEGLELYKIALEADLVLEQGSIDAGAYGNIVSLGCQAKEFDWVKNFMEQYKDNLKVEERDDIFQLYKGIYFFHQKDFENALTQFMNYSYSPRFQLTARLILVETIFELFLKDASLFDLLISQMATFEKYLHRNIDKNGYKKEIHLNFISVLKKMTIGIFDRKNIKNLKASLENQIGQKQKIAGKNWLEKKIKELK